MTSPGSVHSHHHQRRNDEVDAGSEDGVIKGLCERPALLGSFYYVYNTTEVADEEKGGYVPANDCNRLSDREAETTSHIQQKRKVGDQGSAEGQTVNSEEPGHCASVVVDREQATLARNNS